ISLASQLMLEPLGKSNVPTVRHVKLSEISVAPAGGGPRSIVAVPVRAAVTTPPSCVSIGAPGGENTPAARATPPPRRVRPTNTPALRLHRQRRRTRGLSLTVATSTSRSADVKTGSISTVFIDSSP